VGGLAEGLRALGRSLCHIWHVGRVAVLGNRE
jgi:hypothetical protein